MKPVLAALACVVAVAWIYLLYGAGMPTMDMGGGKVMLMPPPSWSIGYAAVTFAMWSIMMVAMMIPSAAPVIVRVASRAQGFSTAALFTVGYLIVWTIFSAVATTAQGRSTPRTCCLTVWQFAAGWRRDSLSSRPVSTSYRR